MLSRGRQAALVDGTPPIGAARRIDSAAPAATAAVDNADSATGKTDAGQTAATTDTETIGVLVRCRPPESVGLASSGSFDSPSHVAVSVPSSPDIRSSAGSKRNTFTSGQQATLAAHVTPTPIFAHSGSALHLQLPVTLHPATSQVQVVGRDLRGRQSGSGQPLRPLLTNAVVPPSTFAYNGVLGGVQSNGVRNHNDSQADVFAHCRPLVESTLQGYSATIFCYGQSGSGKTHTMEGKFGGGGASATTPTLSSNAGILPRSLEYLLQRVSELRSTTGGVTRTDYTLRATFIEIFNEVTYDLFGGLNVVNVVEDQKGASFFVKDARDLVLETMTDALDAIRLGSKHKRIAGTLLNAHSSRSHTIFTVYVEAVQWIDETSGTSTVRIGKLNLVDLAGSERLSASRVEDATSASPAPDAKAAAMSHIATSSNRYINQSLFALGRCITALSQVQQMQMMQQSTSSSSVSSPLLSPLPLHPSTGGRRSHRRLTSPSSGSTELSPTRISNGVDAVGVSSSPAVDALSPLLPSTSASPALGGHHSRRNSLTGSINGASAASPSPDTPSSGGGAAPPHIPYRTSRLTMLLKDSLGGASRTLLIACIRPESGFYESTVSTLRFASLLKRIRNRPIIHEDPRDQALRRLQEDNARLTREVDRMRGEMTEMRLQDHRQRSEDAWSLKDARDSRALADGSIDFDALLAPWTTEENRVALRQWFEEACAAGDKDARDTLADAAGAARLRISQHDLRQIISFLPAPDAPLTSLHPTPADLWPYTPSGAACSVGVGLSPRRRHRKLLSSSSSGAHAESAEEKMSGGVADSEDDQDEEEPDDPSEAAPPARLQSAAATAAAEEQQEEEEPDESSAPELPPRSTATTPSPMRDAPTPSSSPPSQPEDSRTALGMALRLAADMPSLAALTSAAQQTRLGGDRHESPPPTVALAPPSPAPSADPTSVSDRHSRTPLVPLPLVSALLDAVSDDEVDSEQVGPVDASSAITATASLIRANFDNVTSSSLGAGGTTAEQLRVSTATNRANAFVASGMNHQPSLASNPNPTSSHALASPLPVAAPPDDRQQAMEEEIRRLKQALTMVSTKTSAATGDSHIVPHLTWRLPSAHASTLAVDKTAFSPSSARLYGNAAAPMSAQAYTPTRPSYNYTPTIPVSMSVPMSAPPISMAVPYASSYLRSPETYFASNRATPADRTPNHNSSARPISPTRDRSPIRTHLPFSATVSPPRATSSRTTAPFTAAAAAARAHPRASASVPTGASSAASPSSSPISSSSERLIRRLRARLSSLETTHADSAQAATREQELIMENERLRQQMIYLDEQKRRDAAYDLHLQQYPPTRSLRRVSSPIRHASPRPSRASSSPHAHSGAPHVHHCASVNCLVHHSLEPHVDYASPTAASSARTAAADQLTGNGRARDVLYASGDVATATIAHVHHVAAQEMIVKQHLHATHELMKPSRHAYVHDTYASADASALASSERRLVAESAREPVSRTAAATFFRSPFRD